MGGGVTWSHPGTAFSGTLSARGLLKHESGGFRDRRIAGSLGFDPDPGSDHGFSLTVCQTMCAQASGGIDTLLGQGTLKGLAA